MLGNEKIYIIIDKINFNKFISVLENERKYINIFFDIFQWLEEMRKKKRKKKIGADIEMGYCPFEHKAGLGTGRAGVSGKDTHRHATQHGRWARRRAPKRALARGERGTGVGAHGAAGREQGTGALGGTGAGAQGVGARGRGSRRGVRMTRQPGHGLGVLLGCVLCTWCNQPIFDPV